MLEIRYDNDKIKRLERELRGFPKNSLPKVMSRALNRTASEGRTRLSRLLSQKLGLKVKDVRDRIILSKATYSNWRAFLRISRRRIPLLAFKARQTFKGVTYSKGGNRVLIAHAFIQTMVGKKGGRKGDLHTTAKYRRAEWFGSGLTLDQIDEVSHGGVYKRKSSSRLPIQGLAGPSLGRVFVGTPELAKLIVDTSMQRLGKNIHDQVQLILKRRLPA